MTEPKETINLLFDLWQMNGAQSVSIDFSQGRRVALRVSFRGNAYRFPVAPEKIKVKAGSQEDQEAIAWEMLFTLTENFFTMSAQGQADMENLLSPFQQTFLFFKWFGPIRWLAGLFQAKEDGREPAYQVPNSVP